MAKKALATGGISLFIYWFLWKAINGTTSLEILIILKYLFYVNLFVFFNSTIYLRALCIGKKVSDKELVYFNLFIYGVLLLMELPNMLASLV